MLLGSHGGALASYPGTFVPPPYGPPPPHHPGAATPYYVTFPAEEEDDGETTSESGDSPGRTSNKCFEIFIFAISLETNRILDKLEFFVKVRDILVKFISLFSSGPHGDRRSSHHSGTPPAAVMANGSRR